MSTGNYKKIQSTLEELKDTYHIYKVRVGSVTLVTRWRYV